MPIDLIEGFDYYPANVDEVGYGLFSTWIRENQGGAMAFRDGRFRPGKAVRVDTQGNFPVGRATLPHTPARQVVYGFAFFLETALGSMSGGLGRRLISFRDNLGNGHVLMHVDNVGNLNFVHGNGALIFQCPKRRIIQSTWHYLEIAITIGDADGSVNVWIDGENQGGVAGVDTRNVGNANLGQFATAVPDYQPGSYYLDDMYVLVNETQPLGECRIQLLEANSDSDVDFSRSAGATNFGNVGANSSDGDTTYNFFNDPGGKDLFGNTGISVNPDKIHAIGINIAARKEDSGTRTIRGVVKSNGVEGYSSNYNLTVNYTWTRKILLVDPETQAAWTKGRVNAMTLGYELVL